MTTLVAEKNHRIGGAQIKKTDRAAFCRDQGIQVCSAIARSSSDPFDDFGGLNFFCLTLKTFGQICKLQPTRIIPRKLSGNPQTESGLFSQGGYIHRPSEMGFSDCSERLQLGASGRLRSPAFFSTQSAKNFNPTCAAAPADL
jgi:hypothetical protein